jgi:hypothetical protein
VQRLSIKINSVSIAIIYQTRGESQYMPVDEAFNKREHFYEEEYFRKREQEFIAALRRREARQGEIKELGEKLGVSDPGLIEPILDLGFSVQISPLLFLAPVVRMAWADGCVSPQERKMIVELARKEGVAEHSVADLLLAEWLEKKPSETFFYDALLAIRAVLLAIPRKQADARRNEIISRAKALAAVPEGILHGGAGVLETEQHLLDSIEAELSRDFQA